MKIFLLIISFIVTHSCFAASHSMPSLDTPLSVLTYKMNQRAFLDTYGCDDSSTALIRFYYHRRNVGKGSSYTGIALLVLFGLAAVPISNIHDPYYYGFGYSSNKLAWVIALCAVLGVGIAIFSSALPMWLLYSRRRLLKWLNNYFALKHIPRGIARNMMFKGYLQFGRWNVAVHKQVKAAQRQRIKAERSGGRSV